MFLLNRVIVVKQNILFIKISVINFWFFFVCCCFGGLNEFFSCNSKHIHFLYKKMLTKFFKNKNKWQINECETKTFFDYQKKTDNNCNKKRKEHK